MANYLKAAEELRPNCGQWGAYVSTNHCAVLAGPGSGKTKVLTVTMARLLAEEVKPPRGLACVTYNNECARELRRRLDALGVEEADRVFVGTVHSFCLQRILMPYASLAGDPLPSPLRVVAERESSRIFAESLRALHMGEQYGLRVGLDRHRRLHLDRDPLLDDWDENDPLSALSTEYEARLLREGYIDFEEMSRRAVQLVEQHPWLQRCLRAQFPVLVVDEYQDLGVALDRLVKVLCFRAGIRLFAVGDPDQSVYGFTGAKPELLKDLSERPDVCAIRLSLNYRSGGRLVQAALAALGEERGYESSSGEGGFVYHESCPGGLDGQVKYLVDELLPALREQYAPGQIAVLYPSKYEGGTIEDALLSAGVEYVRLGTSAAYDKTPLSRLVEEFAAWCSGGWKTGGHRLSRLLRRWVRLQGLDDSELTRRHRRRVVRFLFDHREPGTTADAWLSALESEVLSHDDCRQRLADQAAIEAFDSMLNAVRPGAKLDGFTVANLGGQLGSPNHLNLVTLHSSKGSEFDVVVLVGADEGSLPWANAAGATLAESRRLYYVAVSRAKQVFVVLSSPAVLGDRKRQGTSRFVLEMMDRLERETP